MRTEGRAVTITKRIAVPLAVCAGGVVVGAAAPARAAGHPAGQEGHTAVGCTYQVRPNRPSGHLDLRSGPGSGYWTVGRLRADGGRFAGSCRPAGGWRKVTASNGNPGWAPAGELRAVPAAERPALGCAYRVRHVRAGSRLHVRSGPGVGYRLVGRLRVADGRFAGACRPSRGWRKVTASNGTTGWAATCYLRRASS
jgi:uncharacterized protein YgiM (DUF1202 family)